MDIRKLPAAVTVGYTAIAAGAVAIAAAIHLASYGPDDWGPALFPAALALFPAVFILFFPAVLSVTTSRMPMSILWSGLPRIVLVGGFVLMVYVFVDFFLVIKLMPGSPEQDANGYFLNDHGALTPINVHQYRQALMYSARLFTGHELWFFAICGVIGYQLDRVRRGVLDPFVAPRDDAIERNPWPAPLSRTLTLQSQLTAADCATRLLQPQPKSFFSYLGRYGVRGEATPEGFRLELANPTPMVYAVGRFDNAGPPTFIRILLSVKRWPVIVYGLILILGPIWLVVLNWLGSGYPLGLFLFFTGLTLLANFAFARGEMSSLLKQIRQATGGQQVSVG